MSAHLMLARKALQNSSRPDWKIEDKLFQLRQAILSLVLHLESQPQTPSESSSSPDTSPTTARVTTGRLWAAGMPTERLHSREREEAMAMVDTGPRTRLLQRVHGVLTEAELTHAVQCSTCADLLAASVLLLSTHVPDAHGTSLTSVSAASNSSVVPESSATSPSASSSPSLPSQSSSNRTEEVSR